MSSIQIFHVTLEIWGAIICAIATICAMNGAKVETRVSHRTAMITANTMVLMIADCLAWAYRGVVSPSAILITRVSNYMVFTCNYLMILLFFFYVQALLTGRFPLRGGELPLLNENLIALIGWGTEGV